MASGEMTWGGVELLTHRYIGNVKNDVSASTIEDDLKARGIEVISLVENDVKNHVRYKSFKLSVRRGDSSKIDDAEFWPSNVIVRRWHNPRQPRSHDDHGGAAAPVLIS